MTDPRNASTPAEVGGCRPCVGTLSTAVVEGPLALRMRRFAAASRGEIGLQILTLPHLAARLAGGFVRPAQREELEPAVQKALEAGGFSDLTSLQQLPGMVRALVRTLQRLWLADTVPADYPDTPRLADLHLIDSRVRAALGPAVLVPPDLVAAARTRLDLAANLLGPVTFEPHLWIAPVWRGLIEDIRRRVPVMGLQDQVAASAGVASAQIFICADPHAEVAEALRWARDLVASGRAAPHEIALATAAPRAWDDHMLALSRSAELPVHFSHGVSILTTMDGQACAALAELLAHGLSQERVHRLLAHSAGRCTGLQALPANPLAGLSAEAHLGDLAQWRRALERAQTLRVDGTRPAAVLIPALELLSQGWPAAEEAGALLLPGSSLTVWRAALRSAPPEALAFSLSCLRVADGRDPANSITWCPASHLAGAPRPFVRLIGLTASAWPRAITTDPILPGHVLAIDRDAAPTLPDGDRRAFATIAGGATGELSLSYPRRNGQGGLQAPSPLLRADSPRVSLARLRIPNHAYSEADRLRARLTEAARDPRYALATRCWRARRAPQVTPHDGILQANHPAILRALAQPQSATSLRRLLRDPQGYVWRYALEWRETMPVAPPLDLQPRIFGDLVHLLLQRTVAALEPLPGFGRAAQHEVEAALAAASERIFAEWPLERATPPSLLWRYTLAEAGSVALRALQLDPPFQPGTRSWTEVRFGEVDGRQPDAGAPWDHREPVPVPGTGLTIRGAIDRLELDSGDRNARVTDYKSGTPPRQPGRVALGRGMELQRVLYAVAVARHRPETNIIARLVYLTEEQPGEYKLRGEALDTAIGTAARHLNAAVALIQAGTSLPGPDDSWEVWNELRLALPAAGEPFRQVKQQAFLQAFGEFAAIWRAQ